MKLQLFSGTTWKPVIRWLRTGEKWAPEMHAIKKERNCLRPLQVEGMGMWLLFLWSCFYRSFHMRFIFMWSGLYLLSKSCFLPENIFPLFGFWITSVCLLYMMAYPGGGPLIEQCSSINGQVKTGVFIDWLICHLSARNFFFLVFLDNVDLSATLVKIRFFNFDFTRVNLSPMLFWGYPSLTH